MNKPYRKIFIQNPSFRFEREPLEALCEELVTVCDAPVFDEYIDPTPDNRRKFEHAVQRKMEDFDPEKDAIAIYGDPLILAMMIQFIGLDAPSAIVLRFSSKKNAYVGRLLSEEFYDADTYV